MNTLHAAFVVSTILFAGCATMINGPRQDIPVRSDPEGAKVHADCGELQGDAGVTPLILAVPRIATDCSLTLSKSGYATEKIVFERQLSRAVAANKAIGIPVGIFGAIITALFGGSQPYLDPQGAFEGGVEIGAAPGKQIDKRSGGAYKQVPGEVTIRLEQTPTGSPISSDWHRMDPNTEQLDKLLAIKTEPRVRQRDLLCDLPSCSGGTPSADPIRDSPNPHGSPRSLIHTNTVPIAIPPASPQTKSFASFPNT